MSGSRGHDGQEPNNVQPVDNDTRSRMSNDEPEQLQSSFRLHVRTACNIQQLKTAEYTAVYPIDYGIRYVRS